MRMSRQGLSLNLLTVSLICCGSGGCASPQVDPVVTGPVASDASPHVDAGLQSGDTGARRDLGIAIEDTGLSRDVSSVPVDASFAVDTGSALDAGPERPDSGLSRDTGSEVVDDLDALLDRWFADYNQGQSTDYLEDEGRHFADGDAQAQDLPEHEYYEGVPYGPFNRNRLDFWQPVSAEPTPVAVFIHGGGFVSGERQSLRQTGAVRRLLSAGIGVATISYRWAFRGPRAALAAQIPNGSGDNQDTNGVRLDYILRDCARSIQYLRFRSADWNLDPNKVAVWGSSAGAGCALWTASVPDLAQEGHSDPVLQQSSRVQVVGHNYGQVTYAFQRWPALLGFDRDWLLNQLGNKQTSLTHLSVEDFTGTPLGRDLSTVLDYYQHLDASDPPMITVNNSVDLAQASITNASQVLHHVRGHYALFERCQGVGMTCAIRSRARNEGFEQDIVAFVIQRLADD